MTTFGKRLMELFDMTGWVAIITGGAGLLGFRYGEIFAAGGAGGQNDGNNGKPSTGIV